MTQTSPVAPRPPLRLFVIGDSISQQYGPALERFLAPRFAYDRKRDSGSDRSADLDVPQGANGGDSRMVLAFLHRRLARDPIGADILLLNCGLHDIKRDPVTHAIQVPVEEYRRNLESILAAGSRMRLRVVWVRITPVIDAVHNTRSTAFHRFADDVAVYNAAADTVMRSAGVPVLDLHGFCSTLVPEAFVDHVHYRPPAQELQAAFLAGALFALTENAVHPDAHTSRPCW